MTPEGHTFVESVQHLEDTSQTFLALPKGPRWGPHRRSGHPSTSLMVDSGAGLRVRARGEWRRGRLWLLRRLTWSLAADLLVVSEFAEKPTSGSRQVRLQARRRPRSEEEWDSWAFAWDAGGPRGWSCGEGARHGAEAGFTAGRSPPPPQKCVSSIVNWSSNSSP